MLDYKGDRARRIAVDQWSLKEQMGDNKQNKNVSKAVTKQANVEMRCKLVFQVSEACFQANASECCELKWWLT